MTSHDTTATTTAAVEARPNVERETWNTPRLRVLSVSETLGGTDPGGPKEGTFYKVS